MSEIRIIPFMEMLEKRLPKVYETMAEKDGKRLWLHFNDLDFGVTEQEVKNERTDSSTRGSGGTG